MHPFLAASLGLNYILYTFNGHGFALFKIIGDGVAIAGGLVLILVLLLFAQASLETVHSDSTLHKPQFSQMINQIKSFLCLFL